MPRVQVVAIDGTVIEADQFKAEKKGLKLERKPSGGGSKKPETIGFVPFDRLMYVVPDDVVHNVEDFQEIPT